MSKAAVNAAGKSLSIDLKPYGVAVAILHPGWVRTDMTSHNGLIDPDESASGLIARMEELTLDTTGTFWHTNGDLLPW
jgi:NAD(P)-dependent dehydrogenase (short-subunit alcohol dehydrogenase family)